MMVNQSIIEEIMLSETLNREIATYLNSVIDEEINKREQMNTDLIDECITALEGLEKGTVEFNKNSKILRFCHRKTGKAEIVFQRAAAIAVILTLSSALALKASPTMAQNAKELISQIGIQLGIAAKSTEDDSEIVSIYLELPESFSPIITTGEEADLSGVKLFAVSQNGDEREISLSDCEVTQQRISGDKTKILLIISYKGCATSIVLTEVEK